MSTYLKWGEIHPRTMLADLAPQPLGRAAETYRKELAWREFYADVLWHDPDSARQDYRRELLGAWSTTTRASRFEAWRKGAHRLPDRRRRHAPAGGDRVHAQPGADDLRRFLVKDLHVWWRHGARHFMEWLADGDLASNQHDWQWVAGTGTDAAPYFRIFNPTTQGKKFDPDGTYVRRWVPELADLPAKEIHEPRDVPATRRRSSTTRRSGGSRCDRLREGQGPDEAGRPGSPTWRPVSVVQSIRK